MTDQQFAAPREEQEKALAVVRELAAFDPYEQEGAFTQCFFCCQPKDPALHLPDCIWSLARQLALSTPSQPPTLAERVGARKVTDEELAPFKQVMEREVIPAIVEDIRKRQVAAADARGKVIFAGPPKTADELRTALETEQTMRAAWEKRAYQAEAVLTALSTPSPVSPQKEKAEVARVDDTQYDSPLATAADASAGSERWDNDDRGLLDDVVVPDVATFRLERMNDRGWWIGLYRRDGTLIHIDVFGEGRRIDARRRED